MVSLDLILKCYVDIPFDCSTVHIRLIAVRIHVISARDKKTSPLNKVDDLFTQKNGVEEANEINALTTISHKLFNLTEGKEIRQTRG